MTHRVLIVAHAEANVNTVNAVREYFRKLGILDDNIGVSYANFLLTKNALNHFDHFIVVPASHSYKPDGTIKLSREIIITLGKFACDVGDTDEDIEFINDDCSGIFPDITNTYDILVVNEAFKVDPCFFAMVDFDSFDTDTMEGLVEIEEINETELSHYWDLGYNSDDENSDDENRNAMHDNYGDEDLAKAIAIDQGSGSYDLVYQRKNILPCDIPVGKHPSYYGNKKVHLAVARKLGLVR